MSNPPRTLRVNGVTPSTSTVQALLKGGPTYPIARKIYVNGLRGFETLLTSGAPGGVPGNDAELDFTECYAHLPFSTFGSVGTSQVNVSSPSYALIPLPAPSGSNAPRAICEDFDGTQCGDEANTTHA